MVDIALARAGATALKRVELSRPVRVALESGVIRPVDDVFDYGCGHGSDIELLGAMGHRASGWDPCHLPDAPLLPAAIVNLGYVLNVIDTPALRAEALKRAWALASRALIVSVRTSAEAQSVANGTAHADGVVTGADTFQKFFQQAEARALIDHELEVQSIPLGVGVFVAFKREEIEQEWLDNRGAMRRRVRRLRRINQPCRTVRDLAYEEHQSLLRPLEEFIAERGRLPIDGEEPWVAPLVGVFGSVQKAFQVVRHVAGEPWWDHAADDRRNELRVRFALSRLRKRPKFTALPEGVQRDVKALFGSYRAACQEADDLLFSIGQPTVVREAAAAADVGKRTSDALYVHVDAVDLLPPVLRVFLGAAEALVGDVPNATLVKVHLEKPRVSYLVYADFDADPHPPLAESWVVDFRGLDVRPHDYRSRENPPVLHRKELFVAPDHPRRATFQRLTQQEERHGLLDEVLTIGTRDGWQRRLEETGWRLTGHRLVRSR